MIQDFVVDNLSNWHIRLSRKRFWRGDYSHDKISAYQTVYTCLETVAKLASPIAPFYTDQLFKDLNSVSGKNELVSVHIADFPEAKENLINLDLEEKMSIAQNVSSMVLSLRKKENIRVRQPLQKIMVPILDDTFETRLKAVESLILTEVNIKEIEYLRDASGVLVKKIKPNFKALGPKYGKMMKAIAAEVNQFDQDAIAKFEAENQYEISINNESITLDISDVEITTQDIPGWLVMSQEGITVALDITISESLRNEGIARELVNRIQNIRKDQGFEVTDKIKIEVKSNEKINAGINENFDYICSETLANSLEIVEQWNHESSVAVELDEELKTELLIVKS